MLHFSTCVASFTLPQLTTLFQRASLTGCNFVGFYIFTLTATTTARSNRRDESKTPRMQRGRKSVALDRGTPGYDTDAVQYATQSSYHATHRNKHASDKNIGISSVRRSSGCGSDSLADVVIGACRKRHEHPFVKYFSTNKTGCSDRSRRSPVK